MGKNKLVVCPEAFLSEDDYNWILNTFKKENIFEISLLEMNKLKCNFFSISQNIVVSEISFSSYNWLRGFELQSRKLVIMKFLSKVACLDVVLFTFNSRIILSVAKSILMIRPINFGFNDETSMDNHYQKKIQLKNIAQLAVEEFENMVLHLKNSDVDVHVFNDDDMYNTPDSILSK